MNVDLLLCLMGCSVQPSYSDLKLVSKWNPYEFHMVKPSRGASGSCCSPGSHRQCEMALAAWNCLWRIFPEWGLRQNAFSSLLLSGQLSDMSLSSSVSLSPSGWMNLNVFVPRLMRHTEMVHLSVLPGRISGCGVLRSQKPGTLSFTVVSPGTREVGNGSSKGQMSLYS